MPATGWSAPALYPMGAASGTVNSGFVSGTLADISPYPCLIPAGSLNLGTRIRLIAHGSYTGTSTTTTLAFGFYLNAPATAIGSGAIALGVAATGTMFSGTGFPWLLEYWGHVAAVSTTGSTTAGSFVGRGRLSFGTALTTWNILPMPTTLAAVTVAQATAAGNTATEQNVQLGVTPAVTVTGLTNIITDELTCELVG